MRFILSVALFIFGLCASSAHSEEASKIQKLFAVADKYKLCLVLITNATKDDFGLSLELDIDSEFYSSLNRYLYYENIMEKVTAELDDLGQQELSDDEENYLYQKFQDDGLKEEAKWVELFNSQGVSTWDEPIRKCVAEYRLGNNYSLNKNYIFD